MVAISRSAALAPRIAASSAPPTLRLDSRGASVVTLQKKLKAAGFDPGAADGAFGPKTLAAVKAFQKSRGLASDGIVGPKTWSALNSATASSGGSGPTLRQGARGEPVRALQNRLNALGFNAGTADGDFGPKTLAAVKAFQKSRGLTADGVVGPKTWDKLGIKVQTPSTPSGGGRVVTGYVNGVPRQITLSPIPNGKEMRSDAAAAFNRMHAAARAAGINLTVNSGFRSMEQQRALYQAYLNGTGNLAAKPGYSNHQGGIAVDINVGGTGTSTYRWLAANASRFGFVRTVPSEPWHWEFRP
ncbi:peptidase [Archangium violaceum]|uniref:peptidoglycan-binding protein n=1 Tax=Archangium violaceum TaxID=83451 RepID=UPI002B320EFF|nr:peptidase [Archangium violaceum]